MYSSPKDSWNIDVAIERNILANVPKIGRNSVWYLNKQGLRILSLNN